MLSKNHKAYLLVGFMFFISYAEAQNTNIDSLISVFLETELEDSLKLNILWDISFEHPNQDERIYYADQLIEIAKQNENAIFEYRGLLQKGYAYRTKGDLDRAAEIFYKAIDIASEINYEKGIASAYLALADVFSVNKNFHTSTFYYQKSIAIFKNTGDSISLATALMNAGDDYYQAYKLDSALYNFNESLIIFKYLNYEKGIAFNLGNIGLVYAKQGKYQEAEKMLLEATDKLKKLGALYPVVVYQLSMSEILSKNMQMKAALDYAHQSNDIAMQEGLKEQIRDASLHLSQLYSQTEDYEKAYHHHTQYVAYRDSINNEETIRKIADLRTEYEVSQKQAEIDLLNQKRERNYIIGLALLFFTLLLCVLVFLLYRNNRIKRTANKMLQKQNIKLELQHNKLEKLNNTKDRFFSIISHDLRGPVNAFNGISSLIKHYIAHNEMGQLREVSEYIDKSARQLTSLLDNLLDWSVKQQGSFPFKPEILHLNPLLQESIDIFRVAAHAKNISMELHVEDEIHLFADRNGLMTILRNLLSNALKFTEKDGLVTLSAYTEHGFAKINVIDTGIGIPEDKVEQLFLLKEKTVSQGTAGEKGLGIGLSLVYEFTQMNNGKLFATSEVGAGSIFTVKLPLSPGQGAKESLQLVSQENEN